MSERSIERRQAVLGCASAVAAVLLPGCVQSRDDEDPSIAHVDAGPSAVLVDGTAAGMLDSMNMEPRLDAPADGHVPDSDPVPAVSLSCPSSTTLESLIDCI